MFFLKRKLSPEEQGREGKELISLVLSAYTNSKVQGESPKILEYNRKLNLRIDMGDTEEDEGTITVVSVSYGKGAETGSLAAWFKWSMHEGLSSKIYSDDYRYMDVIMGITQIESALKKFFEQLRDTLISVMARETPSIPENETVDILNYVEYAFDLSQKEERTLFRLEDTSLIFNVDYDNQTGWSYIRVLDEYFVEFNEHLDSEQFASMIVYEFYYKYGVHEVRVYLNDIHRPEVVSYINLIHFGLLEIFEESEKKSGLNEFMEALNRIND